MNFLLRFIFGYFRLYGLLSIKLVCSFCLGLLLSLCLFHPSISLLLFSVSLTLPASFAISFFTSPLFRSTKLKLHSISCCKIIVLLRRHLITSLNVSAFFFLNFFMFITRFYVHILEVTTRVAAETCLSLNCRVCFIPS